MTKDQIFTAAAIVVLLFTAFVEWGVISWLILASIILLLLSWYYRWRGSN